MKKDVALVLSFFEGRDWIPIEGYKAILEANLNNQVLSTDSILLTNCPKFNTDLTWRTDKQTIRNFKLNRIPVKVYCYAINEKSQRRSLGYIVVPLTSAVEGVEVDPKWYRLLGGSTLPHKSPPSLRVCLSLETMTLDQNNQVNGKCFPSSLSNDHIPEGRKLSTEAKRTMISYFENGSRDESNVANGRPYSHQQDVKEGQKLVFRGSSNGLFVDRREEVATNEDLDPDILDDDNLSNLEQILDKDAVHQIVLSKAGEKIENCITVTAEKSMKKDGESSFVNLLSLAPDEKDIDNSPTNIRNRRSKAKDLLIKLIEKGLSVKASPVQPSPVEKRLLELSTSLGESENATKSRRIDTFDFREKLKGLKGLETSSNRTQTSSPPFQLPQNFEQSEKESCKQSLSHFEPRNDELVAHLNQEEGFFQIGILSQNYKEFGYSVTIIYAKNLSQVVPPKFTPIRVGEGLQFCYSFLGCTIYTDPFCNLDNPEFSAERASTRIRSTSQNLSAYFTQNSFLPVHLLFGDLPIALCTVDLQKLKGIHYKDRVNLEGIYTLHSVDQCSDVDDGNCEAKVAVSVELSLVHSVNADSSKKIAFRVNPILTHDMSDNEIVATDSESSCLGSEIKDFSNNLNRKVKHRYYDKGEELRDESLNHYNLALLCKAKDDIEDWKQEQRRIFRREWSEHEETLYKYIASQCKEKVNLIQGELQARLAECDQLQQHLTRSIDSISLREESLRLREEKVSKLERELLAASENTKSGKHKEKVNGKPQVEMQNQKIERLERQVSWLQEEYVKAEGHVKELTKETVTLRKRLIEGDNLIVVSRKNEALLTRVAELEQSKQYYKGAWLKVLSDLQKLHVCLRNSVERTILNSGADSVGEPSTSQIAEWCSVVPAASANDYNKIKKLRDEKRILLDSGLYHPDHALIKKLEIKIQELVDGDLKD